MTDMKKDAMSLGWHRALHRPSQQSARESERERAKQQQQVTIPSALGSGFGQLQLTSCALPPAMLRYREQSAAMFGTNGFIKASARVFDQSQNALAALV